MKKALIFLVTLIGSYAVQGQLWKAHVPDQQASLNDLTCPDNNTCYAVGSKGGIYKTTDSGNSWFILNNEIETNLSAISCPDNRTCYALGNDGSVYTSVTSGQDWTSQKLTKFGNAIHFVNQEVGFVTGIEAGMLLKTLTGGLTWQEIETNYAGIIKQVQFINNEEGFALGQEYEQKTKVGKEVILKTTDGGYSWNVLYSSTTKIMTDFQMLDSQFGFVSADHGAVLKTTDGGLTWQESTTGSDKMMTTLHFVDNATGYVAGALGELYKTSNRGATWTAIDIEKRYQFLEIFYTPEHKGIAVVAGNTIITQY